MKRLLGLVLAMCGLCVGAWLVGSQVPHLVSPAYGQQGTAETANKPVKWAAAISPPPAAGSTTEAAPAELRIGGLRKRIFTDRDAKRYRVDEESVYAALTEAKESGDITDDMSLVEKARVVGKLLAAKPENVQAFQSITKPAGPEARVEAVRNWANIIKAIMRILELFESVFGEL